MGSCVRMRFSFDGKNRRRERDCLSEVAGTDGWLAFSFVWRGKDGST
jgi:hypothetical protein